MTSAVRSTRLQRMIRKDVYVRLLWRSPHRRRAGAFRIFASIVAVFAMTILVLFAGAEAHACRDGTTPVAFTAAKEIQTVATASTIAAREISSGKDLRGSPATRALSERNGQGSCCTPHVPGAGCSGGNCASCVAATVPAGIASHVPETRPGCPLPSGTDIAALNPGALFRPPRLHA